MLGRLPSVAEVGVWTGLLTSGAPLQQVVNDFVHSGEALGNLVEGAYQNYLGRRGDSLGVDYWLSVLQSGNQKNFDDLITGFLTSGEFMNDTQGK